MIGAPRHGASLAMAAHPLPKRVQRYRAIVSATAEGQQLDYSGTVKHTRQINAQTVQIRGWLPGVFGVILQYLDAQIHGHIAL